ncbi:hypothetical protein MARILYN_27 [Vibrio phage Marilyn]|nr:hypothetical protein MARILYN_27 [Vibrio phage Marilyn]WCD55550.1 hypothetical protein FAYDEN_27 [Vibrio phage Fayden]WCD55607.1 hypothetical protein BAYBAE_27 [Vibrio phage Baybae]WCD55666.1 hypothetical protein VAITEPHAGE_27 [Vibrio phage Vaitephage]
MSKTWIAKCVSFKGKHPQGEVTHRVVVKAQYKKDGIEAAQEELKLFDVEHHDKYKKPELTEVMDESEAERIYIEYMAVREQLEQIDLCDDESNFNDVEQEKTDAYMEATQTLLARYDIIDRVTVNHIMEIRNKLEEVIKENEECDPIATLENIASYNWKQRFPMGTDEKMLQVLLNRREMRAALDGMYIEKTTTEEPSEELVDSGEKFTAEKATIAEYPIIEPYSVRIAVAKQGESFVHSMAVVNREKGGNVYGQLDVFNPKEFTNVENAVVYALAMSIEAVNKYLPHFLEERQVNTCVNILSSYAQDAEGNFIERYMGDHDLSNATFMAVSQPKEESKQSSGKEVTSDVARITAAAVAHPSIAPHMETDNRAKEVYYQIQENFTALHNKYGFLPAAQMVEHIISMSDVSDLITIEGCDELASHYVENTTTQTMQAITESSEEENDVKFYAGQVWRCYIEEILAQFKTEKQISSEDIDAAAKNISRLFNDWKLSLFKEKGKYTIDADMFKDEIYLIFNNSEYQKALELLKDYFGSKDQLVNVLACGFDDYVNELNPKVKEELVNLVNRLAVDSSLGCTHTSEVVKALIYSELSAESVPDMVILKPNLKMDFWNKLNHDYCSNQRQRQEETVGDYVMAYGSSDELRAKANEIDAKAKEYINEVCEPLAQALNEKVQEVNAKAEEYENEACVRGDGVTPESERFTIDAPKTLPDAPELREGATIGNSVEITDEEYSALLNPEDVPEPQILPDDMEVRMEETDASKYYGTALLNGDIDSPYELAIAYMMKDLGAENYHDAGWYQYAAAKLRGAAERLKCDLPALMTGLTVEKLVREKSWANVEELEQALESHEILDTALYEHGVFDYDEEVLFGTDHQQEAPADEPEEARQDIEPDNDDPVTSADNGDSVATDNELSVRELFKRQMAAANQKLGLVGFAWGYEVKRQWTEDKKDGRTDCHVEVGIWFKDKNGTKGEPISFYGVSNANFGNYVNDAMMLAVVNGLEITLISLGVEVEG